MIHLQFKKIASLVLTSALIAPSLSFAQNQSSCVGATALANTQTNDIVQDLNSCKADELQKLQSDIAGFQLEVRHLKQQISETERQIESLEAQRAQLPEYASFQAKRFASYLLLGGGFGVMVSSQFMLANRRTAYESLRSKYAYDKTLTDIQKVDLSRRMEVAGEKVIRFRDHSTFLSLAMIIGGLLVMSYNQGTQSENFKVQTKNIQDFKYLVMQLERNLYLKNLDLETALASR